MNIMVKDVKAEWAPQVPSQYGKSGKFSAVRLTMSAMERRGPTRAGTAAHIAHELAAKSKPKKNTLYPASIAAAMSASA